MARERDSMTAQEARKAREAPIEAAIGYRVIQVPDEHAASHDGFSLTRDVAECDGIGGVRAARYARGYALWLAGLADQPPYAHGTRAFRLQVPIIQGMIRERLNRADIPTHH